MKLRFAAVCLLFASLATPAGAATLYRWTDNSGTVRYGYHPPAGMNATPAEDEQRNLYKGPIDAVCRNLAKDHLRRIDREMDRIKKMPAGLGPEYELTPAAKQELILDLLAHRAALLSGRKASEFRSPSGQDMERLKERYQGEKARLQQALESKDETIQTQQDQLERARRKVEAARHIPIAPYPIVVPGSVHRR
ncbi:DUF4124 domain-containing protein [Methylocaldum sp. GT1TLB]|jgi:hypothetical protein|uniref:DUF4124 domain-containing protein n=1 Tax=Methylocaldum sp. GT1TLB TaxID=3438965 RepID=UPI003DA1C2EA